MRIDAELLNKEVQGMMQIVEYNRIQMEVAKSNFSKSEGALQVLKDMLAAVEKPEPKVEKPDLSETEIADDEAVECS